MDLGFQRITLGAAIEGLRDGFRSLDGRRLTNDRMRVIRRQVRLLEEVKERTDGIFVTLTFSNERFKKYARRHKFLGDYPWLIGAKFEQS